MNWIPKHSYAFPFQSVYNLYHYTICWWSTLRWNAWYYSMWPYWNSYQTFYQVDWIDLQMGSRSNHNLDSHILWSSMKALELDNRIGWLELLLLKISNISNTFYKDSPLSSIYQLLDHSPYKHLYLICWLKYWFINTHYRFRYAFLSWSPYNFILLFLSSPEWTEHICP